MLIVPVKGDRIRTKDDSQYHRVSSFSSLKDEPAVYIKPAGTDPFVYFSDIVEINGVRVEYDSSSKVFNALGPLKIKYNIPQPKDSIFVKLLDVPFKDEKEEFVVTAIRLHSKKYGENKGLMVICKDNAFSISEIISIDRSNWTEPFDREKFKSYYFDYLPIGIKHNK
jgi:hypothetical protein